MNFFEKHKLMQTQLYKEAVEHLRQNLGEGYKVELTKAGQHGKISRTISLIEVSVGSSIIQISTNERGRELKIITGLNIGPYDSLSFKNVSEVVDYIKNLIGDNYEKIKEIDKIDPTEKEQEQFQNDKLNQIMNGMEGYGLKDDIYHEIEPMKVKSNRVYKLALVWGLITKLNTKIINMNGNIKSVILLRNKLYEWITTKTVPTKTQWDFMIQAMQYVYNEIFEESYLISESKELFKAIDSLTHQNEPQKSSELSIF